MSDEFDSIVEPSFEGANLNDESLKMISELSKKGYQFIKENEFEEARNIFNEILKIDDNNNYALVGLGDTERKQNHLNEAIKYYTKCLSIFPENNYALFGLADCYKSQNQY